MAAVPQRSGGEPTCPRPAEDPGIIVITHASSRIGQGSRQAALDWHAALVTGLITSTFSTFVAQLTAARVGGDALVDWMVVGAIPLRDLALQAEPTWPFVVAGILFHQWADITWALVFFGLLGRWTTKLGPWAILGVAVPWAVFTSSIEWLFLVPLVPFWRPLFTLEQPYWLGLVVHLASSSLYPLFPWLRDRLAGPAPSPNRGFARTWAGLALAATLVLALLALFGSLDRELPYLGTEANATFDQAYMRRMAAHHAQGVEVAGIAAEKAADTHLRAVARLMVAVQKGEIAVFGRWWRSWTGGPLPPPSPQDHAAMPGMLEPEQAAALRRASGPAFDPLFVGLMTFHHDGAILMAQEAIERSGDLRLRLMAQAIRHEQRGEIALMHGLSGPAAVRAAISNLLKPAKPSGSIAMIRDEPS
jgi:uncharacterized protein (DUF305 family)